MVARGDAATLRRPCSVDVDEAGDPVRDARDSTSSIVLDCQPLLTLTIAYDRRVRSSDDSWEDVSHPHIAEHENLLLYLSNSAIRRRYIADSTGGPRMAVMSRPVGPGRGRRLHLSICRSLLPSRRRHGEVCSRCRIFDYHVLRSGSLRELRQLRDRGVLAGAL